MSGRPISVDIAPGDFLPGGWARYPVGVDHFISTVDCSTITVRDQASGTVTFTPDGTPARPSSSLSIDHTRSKSRLLTHKSGDTFSGPGLFQLFDAPDDRYHWVDHQSAEDTPYTNIASVVTSGDYVGSADLSLVDLETSPVGPDGVSNTVPGPDAPAGVLVASRLEWIGVSDPGSPSNFDPVGVAICFDYLERNIGEHPGSIAIADIASLLGTYSDSVVWSSSQTTPGTGTWDYTLTRTVTVTFA